MLSLFTLLIKVQQGKPINLDTFYKVLPASIQPRDIFGPAVMVSKNRHKLSIIDHAKFEQLLTQSQTPKTRIEAAKHQFFSSHTVACDSAYMLCFAANSAPQTLPEHLFKYATSNTDTSRSLLTVASVNQQPLRGLFTPAKHAILIENQDCFFQWHTLLRHFAFSVDVELCDIYFAGGKRILNPAFAPFLRQYQRLYCAFDYDLDGLKIAQDLIKKDYAPTQVLLPDDLKTQADLFVFEAKNVAKLQAAQKICKALQLAQLHDVFASTKHFMEQEALLGLVKRP